MYREATGKGFARRAIAGRRVYAIVFAAFVMSLAGASRLHAQEPVAQEGGSDQVIAEGLVVYEASCAGCHQAAGAGVPGLFPPLAGNDRAADPDYVSAVVRGGLEGEIEVNGVTYDGVMPGFSSLDDAQVSAVTAYVVNLGAPAPPLPDGSDDGAVAGTELPFGVVLLYGLGFLIFLATAALVVGPLVVRSREEDGEFSRSQVWLKAGLIVVYFVVATVILPSAVIEADFLAEPPSFIESLFSSSSTWRTVRDLIGAGVWAAALLLGLWALRRAQRDRVI